jgi:hypothetical protein
MNKDLHHRQKEASYLRKPPCLIANKDQKYILQFIRVPFEKKSENPLRSLCGNDQRTIEYIPLPPLSALLFLPPLAAPSFFHQRVEIHPEFGRFFRR